MPWLRSASLAANAGAVVDNMSGSLVGGSLFHYVCHSVIFVELNWGFFMSIMSTGALVSEVAFHCCYYSEAIMACTGLRAHNFWCIHSDSEDLEIPMNIL